MALPPDPAITDSSHDNEDTEEPSEQTAPHTGGAGGGGGGGRKARQFKERGGGSECVSLLLSLCFFNNHLNFLLVDSISIVIL